MREFGRRRIVLNRRELLEDRNRKTCRCVHESVQCFAGECRRNQTEEADRPKHESIPVIQSDFFLAHSRNHGQFADPKQLLPTNDSHPIRIWYLSLGLDRFCAMHLLPLVAPTLTAFVGSGIATAITTHWLTIKRAREELLRAKLEELFLAVSGYGLQVSAMTLPYLSAMRGKISINDAMDLSSKNADQSVRHHEKAKMLVNLYFPEHRELLEKLLSAVYKTQDVLKAFKANYTMEHSSEEAARQYSDALIEADKIENLLLLMISGTSAKLLRPPSLFKRLKQHFSHINANKTKGKD